MKSYHDLVKHEGNDALFFAIEISLISTLAGIPLHLHVEGVRGTGKTTILRAARQWLPDIQQVPGCLYHCDPVRPHCPDHSEQAPPLAAEARAMPFLEISHSAKLGTVVGSIDLARLTNRERPTAALLPGTLPQAHRGVVLIDEINRLAETAPDLADVMLSVMGTKPGRVQIEETGLPVVELPVNVSVWAASNPDEEPGPLEDVRRQLADRFDLVVPVRRPTDARVVRHILTQRTSAEVAGAALALDRQRLAERAARLPAVVLPEPIAELIARLYVDYNLESLRAVEALAHASRLAAVVAGHEEVVIEDLLRVVPLALRHRVEAAVLSQILKDLAARQAAGSQATGADPPAAGGERAPASGARAAGDTPDPRGEGEEEDEGTAWHKLFSRLRDCFGLSPAAPPTAGRGTAGSPQRRTSRLAPGSGSGGSALRRELREQPGGSGVSTTLTDPMLMPVNAPPRPGRPLVTLPGWEVLRPAEDG